MSKSNAIPDDLRRQANHIANMFHQKQLAVDLASAIATALWQEREQSAAIAKTFPAQVEKEPGLMRRSTGEDIYRAIMKVRK